MVTTPQQGDRILLDRYRDRYLTFLEQCRQDREEWNSVPGNVWLPTNTTSLQKTAVRQLREENLDEWKRLTDTSHIHRIEEIEGICPLLERVVEDRSVIQKTRYNAQRILRRLKVEKGSGRKTIRLTDSQTELVRQLEESLCRHLPSI